ncbi:hypothetical protein ACLB2K_061117 [Fragaria x ananassa]
MVDDDGKKDEQGDVVEVDANGKAIEVPPNLSKKRKLTSKVWLEFEKKINPDGSQTAKCKHCRKSYVSGSDKGTSHLKKHLGNCTRRNKRGIDQLMVVAETNESGDTSIEKFKFDQERSRMDFAKMVIKHNYSFSMAEHEYFEIFLNHLQPSFKLVCRNTVRSDILKVHKKEKEQMCNFFERYPGRVSLTTDIWTSDHQDIGYICLTSHFIGEDWELKKKILAYRCIEYPHDADTLFRYITDLILDWNLEKKLLSMVVDNASVNDAMVRSLKSWLCDKSLILLEGKLFHVRCSAHILNLIVQDGLQVIGGFIFKVRESVKYLKRSGYATQKFNQAKTQLKLKDKKKVKMDCPTRWNSTFLMIKSALEMKEVFWRLSQTDRNYKHHPTDEEWKTAEVISDCLEHFYAATNHFSGSSFPTSNVFFPDICKIKMHLSKWEKSEHEFLRLMAVPMKEKFDKYWDECSLVLAVGVVFDPRFKMQLIEYYFEKLHGSEAYEYIERVRTAMFDLFTEYEDDSSQSEMESNLEFSGSCNDKTVASRDDELSGFDAFVREGSSHIVAKKKSELEQYLEEPLFPRAEPFNVLNWWKINSAKCPTLARMARDILAVPATTVASEAAFSVGGRVIDESRASMLPETVEALVTTKDWLPSRKRKRSVSQSEEEEVPK